MGHDLPPRQPADLERLDQPVTAEHDQDREPTDAERIAQGIAWAAEKERQINHATARVIASQLHEGQGSALYSFASSGAIDKQRLGPELAGTYIQEDTPDEVKTWIESFGRYLEQYEDREPVEDWSGRHTFDAVPSPDDQEHEEFQPPIEIYVASLTDYNNGRGYGVWIDATLDVEEIKEAVEHMLRNSYFPNAEEYSINDTSGFGGVDIHEYESLENVALIAKAVEDHGDAFVQWINHYGRTDVDDTVRQFTEHYVGSYESEQAYAEYILDAGDYNRLIDEAKALLPEHLRDHLKFDLETYAQTLASESTILEGNTEVHVFSS